MKIAQKNIIRKPPSEETKIKMSLAAKGRKQSKEHIKNSAKARLGFKHSEISLKKMQEAQNKRCKLVLCLSTGIFYKNSREAAVALCINSVTLTGKLNGNKNNNTNLIYV